jgi:hypothetical protein
MVEVFCLNIEGAMIVVSFYVALMAGFYLFMKIYDYNYAKKKRLAFARQQRNDDPADNCA